MTKLTLMELVDALDIPAVPEMDREAFRAAAELNLSGDEMFCALLKSEGLTACQGKLLRWAHDLYGAEPPKNMFR